VLTCVKLVRVPAPTYQRIADDLRRSIVDGELPPGANVPSRHELARAYGVSDRVAVEAVRLLVAEGLVEARSGSRSYVRQRPERQRLTRSWYTRRLAVPVGHGCCGRPRNVGVIHRAGGDDAGHRRPAGSRARRPGGAHHLHLPGGRQAGHAVGELGARRARRAPRSCSSRRGPHAGRAWWSGWR
jgi:DNA-binding transcriptional regulator YhcF (GntR family)